MKNSVSLLLLLVASVLSLPTRERRYVVDEFPGYGYGYGPYLSAGKKEAALLSAGGIGGGYDQKDAAHLRQDHVGFIGQTKSGLEDGSHYLGDTSYGQAAQGSQKGVDAKGWVKGHQSKGFRKTYHKDESGSDSSFYDSDHDEGVRAGDQGFGQYFGTKGNSGYGGAVGKGALEVGSRGLQSTISNGGAEGALLHHNQLHHNENGQHLLAGPVVAGGGHILGHEAGLYRPELLGTGLRGLPVLGGELIKKPPVLGQRPIYPLVY